MTKIKYLRTALLLVLTIIVSSFAAADNVYVLSGYLESGTLLFDGAFSLGDITQYEEDVEAGSQYSAVFYDGLTQLKEFYFETSDMFDPLEVFQFSVEIPSATERIVFNNYGNSIYEYNINPTPPVVTNIQIQENSGEFYITWTGSAQALEYSLYTSLNDGPFEILTTGLHEPSFTISEGTLAAGQQKMKVVASDGFNTGEAISDYVPVPNNEPFVFITYPNDNSAFSNFSSTFFTGWVYDTEDGEITDTLVWTSNIDGILSNDYFFEYNLTVGTHTITLEANDGQLTSYDSIIINITNATTPDINIQNIEFYPENPIQDDNVTIIATVHNIITGADFEYAFYNGDPNNGGTLIFESFAYAYENALTEIYGFWPNVVEGTHDIYLVISNATPKELDEMNNIASNTIQISLPDCNIADTNSDGFVGGADITRVLAYWGQFCDCSGLWCNGADTDQNGLVGGNDYTNALTYWGHSTGPCLAKDLTCPPPPELLSEITVMVADEVEASPSDSDEDSVNDELDRCPDTENTADVDANGCSAKQFCEAIEVPSKQEREPCWQADWLDNEDKPKDCKVMRNKKTNKRRCTNKKKAD